MTAPRHIAPLGVLAALALAAGILAAVALAVVPGRAQAAAPCFGDWVTIAGQPACVMIVSLQTSRTVRVIVSPDSIDEQAARDLAVRQIRAYCPRIHGAPATNRFTLQKGRWAMRGTWQLTGYCE